MINFNFLSSNAESVKYSLPHVKECINFTCNYVSELFQSVDMYLHTIPEDLHSQYFEDLFSVYKKYLSLIHI